MSFEVEILTSMSFEVEILTSVRVVIGY